MSTKILCLVFVPFLVFGIESLLSKIPLLQKFWQQVAIGFSALLIGFYILVVSNKYYEWTDSRDRFGLEVLSTFNASGAADFILQNKIQGRCFSDYLTSSYLLWRLQPDFKTFIDLRDLDVFPADFFNTFFSATLFPDAFIQLDSTYHFDYVVLYRPNNRIHDYLCNGSNYKLAFIDPVAAVYVKKSSPTDSSIINFSPSKTIATSFPSSAVNKILNPFYSPFDYASVDYNLIAAAFSISVNRLNEAEQFALRSAANPKEEYKTKEMLGEIYYHKALMSPDENSRIKFLSAAQNYFQQSLSLKDNFPDAYLGLSVVLFEQKNYRAALEISEKCLSYDKANRKAYIIAGQCCSFFVNQNTNESPGYLDRAISYFAEADKLQTGTPFVLFNLGVLYFRKGDCARATPVLKQITEMPGVSEEQRTTAKNCLQKCSGL